MCIRDRGIRSCRCGYFYFQTNFLLSGISIKIPYRNPCRQKEKRNVLPVWALVSGIVSDITYRSETYHRGNSSAYHRKFYTCLLYTSIAVAWSIFSYGFSFYFEIFPGFSNMYGNLATIIMVMVWLYICMNLLLYGAEINAYFEKEFRIAHKSVQEPVSYTHLDVYKRQPQCKRIW